MHACVSLIIPNHPFLQQGTHVINQVSKAGETSLHRAAKYGHTHVIDVLLSHGADINSVTREGQSCLHLAAKLCNKPEAKVGVTQSLSQVKGQPLAIYIIHSLGYMDEKIIHPLSPFHISDRRAGCIAVGDDVL